MEYFRAQLTTLRVKQTLKTEMYYLSHEAIFPFVFLSAYFSTNLMMKYIIGNTVL